MIVSYFIFVFGTMIVASGYLIALTYDDPQARKQAALHYFGKTDTGQIIDQGLNYLLVAIAIGIISEIGLILKKSHDTARQSDNINPKV